MCELKEPLLEITLKHYGSEYSVKLCGDDVTLPRVIESFLGLLVSATFHINNVQEIFEVLQKNDILE